MASTNEKTNSISKKWNSCVKHDKFYKHHADAYLLTVKLKCRLVTVALVPVIRNYNLCKSHKISTNSAAGDSTWIALMWHEQFHKAKTRMANGKGQLEQQNYPNADSLQRHRSFIKTTEIRCRNALRKKNIFHLNISDDENHATSQNKLFQW